MLYPRRVENKTEVYRLLQCETCERMWHRDISAAFNIGQIACHILIVGRQPWRVVEGEGGQATVAELGEQDEENANAGVLVLDDNSASGSQ